MKKTTKYRPSGALAFDAIQRDALSTDKETQLKADEAMDKLISGTLTKKEISYWSWREYEYRLITQ